MLIGREYTKKSDQFLTSDKQYKTTLHLGITTDSFDIDGEVVAKNDIIPTLEQVQNTLARFQGEILQTPPMFSAKKVKGQKLYDLARKGITIDRVPVKVKVQIELLSYNYPYLELLVDCSKGTYIRSLGHDIGQILGCGAHLSSLTRTRSGSFTLAQCIAEENIKNPQFNIEVFHV